MNPSTVSPRFSILFFLIFGLAACSPLAPLSDEAQLGTMVAQTLTAQPATFTPIPAVSATSEVIGAEVIPTGDAQILSGMLGCSPGYGLALFKIAAGNTFRNWEGMRTGVNETQVICSEPPGDSATLICELPKQVTFPATVTFGVGDGIAGTFTFTEEQCSAAEFTPSMGDIFTNTTAQNVNLRANPGLLFPVSRVMAQGTRLQLLGMSAGGDWAFVQNNEGVNGWVDLTFVKGFPKAQLVITEPQGVQEIEGSVVSADGVPMRRINFAITQGSKRTEAKTNALGEFHAYLPTSASGTWTMVFISFDTESNALTPECLLDTNACGRTVPASVDVSLPTNSPILFGWE